MQQQRENHLKRIQAQAAQAQAHLQQQATDNLNQQSHAQPLSISLLPQKPAQQSQTPPTPPPQTPANQPANSNIAQFAERLFQTPLDQQKPLSQEQFKALVAAGYPVQAVPVPIAVSGPKAPQASAPQASSYPPQLVQRYSPSTASLAHPQPFAHHPKQPQSITQEQYEQQTNAQVQRPTPAPQHHQQVQLQAHRFYPQRQYSQPQPNPHTTYQYRVPEGGVPQQQQHHHQQPPTNPRPQHGPYTYILQQGENEESAAEQLRQQILQQINAQSQKGAPSNGQHVHPQPQSGGFIPTRLEYSQQTPAQGHRVAATPSPPPAKPLTEEQKEYYKRLEYY